MSGRIRSLKPEFLEDEALGLAGDNARMLAIGLLLLADDHGRGRANEQFLAAHVWSYDPREGLEKVREGLARLSGAGFVIVYEADGQRYFEIRNWKKHQRVDKPGKPRVPVFEPGNHAVISFVREAPEKVTETLAKVPGTLATDQDQDQEHRIRSIGSERVSSSSTTPLELVALELDETPRVFAYWQTELGRQKAKPDPKRLAVIRRALKSYSVDDVMLAIDGCKKSDWNMGRDPKTNGKKFNDLTLILRDAEHIERFIDLASAPQSVAGFMPPSPPEAFRNDSPEDVWGLEGTNG